MSGLLNPYWESGIKRGLYWHLLGLLESTNVLVSALGVLFLSWWTTLGKLAKGANLKTTQLEPPISHQLLVGTESLKALMASTWSVWAM